MNNPELEENPEAVFELKLEAAYQKFVKETSNPEMTAEAIKASIGSFYETYIDLLGVYPSVKIGLEGELYWGYYLVKIYSYLSKTKSEPKMKSELESSFTTSIDELDQSIDNQADEAIKSKWREKFEQLMAEI